MNTIDFNGKVLHLPEFELQTNLNFPGKLIHILKNRGIENDFLEFLKAPIEKLRTEEMKGIREAIQIIKKARDKKVPITIYGDYDCDGITGTALAYNVLSTIGCQVDYYINDRFEDGFGINVAGVEKIAAAGTKLIITVDNGITGIEAIQRAKELNMAVIVTDHHEPGEILPDCVIVNPKQKDCPYPFKELAGVGVIFKVMHHLMLDLGRPKLALAQLDLVALGTVADVVSLLDENRIMVKNGLKLINWGEKARPGFKALKEAGGLEKSEVKSYHLGFVLGPMINAEGRLKGQPDKAIKLLTTADYGLAKEYATYLAKLNRERQDLVVNQLELAKEMVEEEKSIIIIKSEKFLEGIVGLLAGRLKEEFNRPVIILAEDKDGNLKGSGRSIPEFHLKNVLDKYSMFFESYGGHSQAVGLTLKPENFVMVKNFLETEAKKELDLSSLTTEITIDGVLDVEDITLEFLQLLEEFEPFGEGFKKPWFFMRGVTPDSISLIGDNKHTKFNCGEISFLAFNTRGIEDGIFDVIGYPQLNIWKGTTSKQFVVNDITKVV